MRTLYLYSTSRAIRREREKMREEEGFLPTLMRIDEFEKRIILIPNLKMVDTLQRGIYLHRASHFEEFKRLKIDSTILIKR